MSTTEQPPADAEQAHPTIAERRERGKAARAEVPRSSHGDWAPATDRPDPIAILEAQNESRVPELLPIRHARMSASAFAFYRGGAAIMAADLAPTPVSGIRSQLCGDAHIANFGIFAAPDRSLVFDLNDFDETLPGPWEWDLKRMAASIEIAGRHRAFRADERREIVLAGVGAYRAAMRRFAEMPNLALWYARIGVEDIQARFQAELERNKAERKAVQKQLTKAASKTSARAVVKLTEVVDGELRFREEPPLLVRGESLLDPQEAERVLGQLHRILEGYSETLSDDRRHLLHGYRLVDIARKVVGVGSVGTRAWIVLLLGADEQDALVLQAKEAQASVLEPFAGASAYEQHGQRVVEGQRLMQAASDIFLGWERVPAPDGVTRDFYLRQLWDGKGSADLETITPGRLHGNVQVCGWTLARAHARSGDGVAIASYLGKGATFDEAIADFAIAYADQNEKDYAALRAAIDEGRLPCADGPV